VRPVRVLESGWRVRAGAGVMLRRASGGGKPQSGDLDGALGSSG